MDIEDARKRLQFPDSSIQARCIQRLIDIIEEKKPKNNQLISSDNPQIPELALLWELCGCDSYRTSSLVSEALTSLVLNGSMDWDFTIQKITNSAISAKNSVGSIRCLTNLMIHNVCHLGAIPASKYALHFPKHPFILVLEERPEFWPVILQNIIDTITNEKLGTSGFQVMEPVISFVLFHHSKKHEMMMMQQALIAKFLVIGDKHPMQVIKYLCEILPSMQLKEPFELENCLNVIHHICHLLQRCDSPAELRFSTSNVLMCSLSLASSSMDIGLDPTSALDLAATIIHYLEMTGESFVTFDACYVLLSCMLRESSLANLQKLVGICYALFKKIPASQLISAMLISAIVPKLHDLGMLKLTQHEGESGVLMSFLQELETHIRDFSPNVEENVPLEGNKESRLSCCTAFNYAVSHAFLCAKFIRKLEKLSAEDLITWLIQANDKISTGCQIPIHQFSLTISVYLVSTRNKDLLQNVLPLLETICAKDLLWSTSMLVLLLHKHTHVHDPECLQLIMEYLPKTATHKYAVGLLLNLLQVFSNNQELRPLAIHLMLQLWKKQDRCFPYLQKILSEDESSVSFETGISEAKLMQSIAIKELCVKAPLKYGGEFLTTLSAIINKSLSDSSAPAALLALDAIYHLCESEALDLRSAWQTLAPKLAKDKRSSIAVKTCKLLSLTNQLKVNSFQYAKFMNDIAMYLWRLVSLSTSSPAVVGEAYKALSNFPDDCHKLKDIPKEAKVNLKLPPSMMATPYEAAKSPEDVLTYIPGYCFVDYLKNMKNVDTLKGYKHFLQSVVKNEVLGLPRGAYVLHKTVGKRNNPSDVLSNVPGMLCTQYDPRKSSSGKKNLAVGILLSYEPPVELDKEGKPLKRSLALHMRSFEQILEILLNEVNLDCNEWQRCILLPHGWAAFMERALFAGEESRRAELELQKNHGHLKGSDDEIAIQFDTAWLWVRDRILDRIKFNVATSSVSAANAVFAISGLARATEKFYAGLEEKTKKLANSCEKYIEHDDFQTLCTESILSVFDPAYRTSSKILGWLLAPLSRQSLSANSLIRGCAAAALCNLQVAFARSFDDKVPSLFDGMLINLAENVSNVLSLYTGIGLGLFIQSLCQAGYAEGSEEKAKHILQLAEKLLETCNGEDAKCGNLIALTIAVGSLSRIGIPMYSLWVQNTCREFHDRLLAENSSSMLYDFLSICAACIMISGCASNILPLKELEKLSHWLYQRVEDLPQCSSSAICLGLLLDSLINLGDKNAEETLDKMKKHWLNTLASEKEPTLRRLAALNGLSATFSFGRGLIKVNVSSSSLSRIYGLKEFTVLLSQFLSSTKDAALQNVSSWELGRLYAVNNRDQSDANIAPSSYSYLSDQHSSLRPLVQFVADSIETAENIQLQVALDVLSQKLSRPLPPLNWTTFLTPVLQTKNANLMEACLKICLHQMASSTGATTIISLHSTPPLLHSLPDDCHVLLLKNLPILSASLSPSTLSSFLKASLQTALKDEGLNAKKIIITSQALIESHKLHVSNKTTSSILENVFSQIVQSFCTDADRFDQHLPLICEIFRELPSESQISLSHDLEQQGHLYFIFLIHCHLVRTGAKPIATLKTFLEQAKYESHVVQGNVITALLNCFAEGMSCPESDISEPEKCVAFLMEMIGWINIISQPKTMNLQDTAAVVPYMFDVCLAILIGSSGLKVCYALWSKGPVERASMLQALPTAFFELIKIITWEDSMNKIISWLLKMKSSSYFEAPEKDNIQTALCSLRFSTSCSKTHLWTEVINRPVLNI